jgi:pyruvate dehydrogenase E2 component (dihydrolipoamide acetyltransferase)
MEQGRIVAWRKKEGERVAKGDVLLEIETDKANMEVEATESGVVLKHVFAEGANVPATHLIAIIGDGNESAEEIARLSSQGDTPAPVKTERPAEVAAPSQTAPKAASGGKAPASPLARRLAQEMGIDIATVQGSGPGGRIEKEDVLKAAEGAEPAAPAGDTRVPHTPMRRAIARHVTRSMQEIPNFSVTMAMDMTAALRKKNELKSAGKDVSLNDILIFAVSRILPSHPNLNAEFQPDALLVHQDVHIGFAVGAEDGLYIPVVRSAGKISVEEIAVETRRLTDKVAAKTLMEEEMAGGTFTISNLGMFGVESFTAIISPPQTAILSLGEVRESPVRTGDGSLAWHPEMAATVTVDHRAVDGLAAAKFLAALREFLKLL